MTEIIPDQEMVDMIPRELWPFWLTLSEEKKDEVRDSANERMSEFNDIMRKMGAAMQKRMVQAIFAEYKALE